MLVSFDVYLFLLKIKHSGCQSVPFSIDVLCTDITYCRLPFIQQIIFVSMLGFFVCVCFLFYSSAWNANNDSILSVAFDSN